MSGNLNYKVDENDVVQIYSLIPAGDYIAIIEDSLYESNKNGNGKILRLTFKVIDGNFKERKLFENLNLEFNNPTPGQQQSMQINKKKLNSIGVATGVLDIEHSSQLHNIPMKIKVGIKKPSEKEIKQGYTEDKNIIKDFESLNGSNSQPVQQVTQQQVDQPHVTGVDNHNATRKQPPWVK